MDLYRPLWNRIRAAKNIKDPCPDGQHIEGDPNRVYACVPDAETAAAQQKSGVFIESWKTLVRDTVTVNAGQALQYNFTLESGTRLAALFHVEGGINDKVQILLLDSANYELYKAHRPFAKTPATLRSSRVSVNTTSGSSTMTFITCFWTTATHG